MSVESVTRDATTVRGGGLKKNLQRFWMGLKDLFVNILGQVRVLEKIYPGVMHFMLFWGVAIQVVGTIINLMQMALFLPWEISDFPRNAWYLGYELAMDIAGVFIILGVLMALFRRLVLRPKSLETRWDDYYALAMLFLIAVVGYVNEGTRLVAANPEWAVWSPVGSWVAGIMRSSGLTVSQAAGAHDALVITHTCLALILVASVPFTKMRHLINGPLNILVRPRREMGELDKVEDLETAEILGVGKAAELKPQQLLSVDACLRCGRCEDACPSNFSGMPYSPRELVQMLYTSMQDSLVKKVSSSDREIFGSVMQEEYPWQCTTCGACIIKCPVFINPVDEVIDLRRYQVLTSGKMPKFVGDIMRNLERQGNPWAIPPESRLEWAEGLNVRQLSPGEQVDVLFFTGCAAAFDERNKKVTRAFVQLMQMAGVDFAVLGLDEVCCGEMARRMGHEYLFQEFAKQNIETLGKVKFNRIVTTCPHCYNTLKNEYPQMGGNYEVLHNSEFLAGLDLPEAKLNGNGLQGRLTYHDSCYLGRYNNIYSQPRGLLDKSGVKRVEMARRGKNSFCCGGGGGGMWLETDASMRINDRRLQDALDVKADLVATACPYCLIMLDAAVSSKGLTEQVKVLDVTEVLVKQLGE